MTITLKPQNQNARALSELVSLIANAAEIVEAHYLSQAGGYTPSLDDTKEHPLDSQPTPPVVRSAVQAIEAACAQLCATVVKPKLAMINTTLEMYTPPCLNVAVEIKIADTLLHRPEGMHIEDLAIAVNVDSNKLGRILRLLATKHIFREVCPNVFANNRLSMQLVSQNPISSYAWTFTGEIGKLASEITNVLKDPEWGPSKDPRKTAFNKYTGYPGMIFDYMEPSKDSLVPRDPRLGSQFAMAMIGLADATETDSVVHEYPWHELPEGATVCDLGGGVGHMLMKIGRAHPHLQLALQDMPERITQAREAIWPEQFPEAMEEGRIEFIPIDFFTEPPVAGCNIYFMKYIIHDWPADKCIEIFKNIRKVMAPYSRVLVFDYLIQHACRMNDTDASSQQEQAPAPLLRNYGVARIRQYAIDMAVMTMFNGTERVLEDVLPLAKAADLQLRKVWDLGELAIIELSIANCL